MIVFYDNYKQYVEMIIISGGSKGGIPGAPPPRAKIFSILFSFSEILVKLYVGVPRWRVGAPSTEILDPPLVMSYWTKIFSQMAKTYISKSIGTLTPPPPGQNFSQFHAVFGKFDKIVCWRSLGGFAPRPLGNPGSATEKCL